MLTFITFRINIITVNIANTINKEVCMNFGTILRNLRIQRGITQQRLAEDLEISQSAVTAYETGRNEPNFAVIEKFAKYFNVSPYSLIPFGDIFDENEKAIIGEIVLENEKLADLIELVQNFNDSDLDTLITVARSLRVKYGE